MAATPTPAAGRVAEAKAAASGAAARVGEGTDSFEILHRTLARSYASGIVYWSTCRRIFHRLGRRFEDVAALLADIQATAALDQRDRAVLQAAVEDVTPVTACVAVLHTGPGSGKPTDP